MMTLPDLRLIETAPAKRASIYQYDATGEKEKENKQNDFCNSDVNSDFTDTRRGHR